MKRIIGIVFFSLLIMSCNQEVEETPCYDPSLIHNNPCTLDCPGFQGCDDNFYCNECEAAKKGVGQK